MMNEQDIAARAGRVEAALKRAFGVRGRDLDHAVRRTGRRLPRRLRADAKRIVEAGELIRHPKLMRRIDPGALDRAEARLMQHLKGVDRREARIDRWLGIAGSIAFNLLLVALLTVGWLVWTGRL